MLGLIQLIILMSTVVFVAHSDFLSDCPSYCKCKWISGKRAADCKEHNLTSIPETLNIEIQTIDLSENRIDYLPDKGFELVSLTSLFKIDLQHNQIKEIKINAFKGLSLLVDLDLSQNKIQVIHPGTFADNVALRTINLRENPIQKIQANLFTSPQLQKLDLSYCTISEIEAGAFSLVKSLTELKIEGNKLSSLKLDIIQELTKLRSFYFYENIWNCDCNLRDLRDWVIEKRLLTEPVNCVEPPRLKFKLWKDIQPDDFACEPKILWPPPDRTVSPDSQNLHVSCQVSGNPLPQVNWYHNSMIIAEDSTIKYNANKYVVNTNTMYDGQETIKWVNLTVQNVNPQDKGQFRCHAESPGGTAERNITILLDGEGGGVVNVSGYDIESWPLIIGLATGLTALFIVLCILICCLCCRYRQGKSSKLSVTNSDKQDESLLTVNPIQKPPRSNDPGISPDEGVEMSELNTKLLDEHSLQGTICTSERSAECLDSIPEACPPDLLAFRRYPPDPLRTPGVHSLNRFGTLPYSRSHSPLTPLVLPRQGYVTIPRRPRVPSWSSAPTPSLLDDPLLSEPIYDNLGPRTTADGSSALSLNKSLPDHPRKKKTTFPPYYFHFDSPCPSPLAALDNKKEEFKRPPLTKTPLLDGEVTTPVKKVGPKPPPKPKKDGPLFEDEGEDGTEV